MRRLADLLAVILELFCRDHRNLLFSNFKEHKIAHIPAGALIGMHLVNERLRLIQARAAEEIWLRQAAKLVQKIVGEDVVGPG